MGLFFSIFNWWAILVSAIAYWLVGMIWFSAIVGKSWASEIQKHGVRLTKPTTGKMVKNSVCTLILNFITAFGVALFVHAFGIGTVRGAITLGAILGIFFAVSPMLTSHLWEGKSAKLSFYDVFYPFVGIIVSAIILALWR